MPEDKTGWTTNEQRTMPSAEALGKMIETAFPDSRLIDIHPLSGGLSNSNYKVSLDNISEPIVLRIYGRNPAVCQKEVDVHRMLRGSVPVPEIFHAEPDGIDENGPFLFMQFIEGITFRELKRNCSSDEIAQASYSVGKTLAAIGQHSFSKSGWIDAGPAVTKQFVEGPNPIPKYIDSCLASPNLQPRMNESLRDKVHNLIWSEVSRLSCFDESRQLVHCDFNSPNLLVKNINDRWSVVSVLDWEFAISGSPLFDIGNFLRYERRWRG